MAAEVIAGAIPRPGQLVYLGREASPEFTASPFRLLLTAPVQASSVDLAAGRSVDDAAWLLLTGWELDERQRRRLLRTVSARRMGLIIVVGPR
ncbi:hypothetical protein Athai_54400 [Actinocatenispora thailandica]|uniref:Uncharacterized protein n=1 Tax=Actinocatenispora thailandica TaxID=227318 RepID=A0A7R7DV75_9ACTN|nr:hypothetical protein [Actinocatenispora thailandica]BCJ37937.1 hypothetical protein Athai_54400 [Actinocatenispora thailandica]